MPLANTPHPIDFWVKVAQIVQGLLTPAVAIVIGIITWKIQRRQVKTQQQQAETNRLQYRLTLFERRMKVFDAVTEFITLVLRQAKVEDIQTLFKLIRDAKERHLLFGSEIGDYINEVFEKGLKLNTIHATMLPGGVMRPENIDENMDLMKWFAAQTDVAEQKFLQYIDFREP